MRTRAQLFQYCGRGMLRVRVFALLTVCVANAWKSLTGHTVLPGTSFLSLRAVAIPRIKMLQECSHHLSTLEKYFNPIVFPWNGFSGPFFSLKA